MPARPRHIRFQQHPHIASIQSALVLALAFTASNTGAAACFVTTMALPAVEAGPLV
jgi:hypothetical protein